MSVIIEGTRWRNIKNGRIYKVLKPAIDCTNERDGLEVVVYSCERHYPGKSFVREESEFLKKFECIKYTWKDLYEKGYIVNGIDGFDGKYEVLSNFYKLKNPIIVELPIGSSFVNSSGVSRKSYKFYDVETAFQACKSLYQSEVEAILGSGSPGKAKRAGRKVHLREDWEYIKVRVMKDLLLKKLAICPEFVKTLKEIDKDKEIVEMNGWNDTYWGVDKNSFRGSNHLGELLMNIKEFIE